MAKARQDVFVNRALFRVTMSAANTLTFGQLRFAIGVFGKTALIINRIDWKFTEADELAATTDNLELALTNRDDMVNITPDNMNVFVYKRVEVVGYGTPASAQRLLQPIESDFSRLPGGGLIVPANPLFVAVTSAGLTTAVILDIVMYYLTKELVDADYIELVQSLIPVNI